jgi:hypothetical protein
MSKRNELESLIILRANIMLTQDILLTLKQNPALHDTMLIQHGNKMLQVIEKRISKNLKNEDESITKSYLELAENLVKSFNDAAQIEFMDVSEKEATKENQWFSVELKGEKAYAQYSNERYWIARNPKGYLASELKINGQMA